MPIPEDERKKWRKQAELFETSKKDVGPSAPGQLINNDSWSLVPQDALFASLTARKWKAEFQLGHYGFR